MKITSVMDLACLFTLDPDPHKQSIIIQDIKMDFDVLNNEDYRGG